MNNEQTVSGSSDDRLVVHKFGGSSLADADRFQHVAAIVAERPERRRAVVVSAVSGITDTLLKATRLAGARDAAYLDTLAGIRRRHAEIIGKLASGERAERLLASLDADLEEIAHVLRAASLLRGASRDTVELVSGYGEVWSARLLAATLAERSETAAWLDARTVLQVEPTSPTPSIDWDISRARVTARIAELDPWGGDGAATLVVTGFVASTADGRATTLGRNGSDYSASIFADLLDAAEIHIWTDVDGVMSANPRLVPEAVTLDALSYDEALELAYFGAKVVHPSTMAPALRRGLPLYIRNTFKPAHPGTLIDAAAPSRFVVKGLATIEDVALLNLEGTGLIGVPGTAQRLFGALREADVSVIMISQGSSEHSICFAVPEPAVAAARAAVERAFFAERHHGQILDVQVVPKCSILAVVGDGMAGTHGVAAKFFGALSKANVNVRAIAQGSSERNISAVVDAADTQRALRAAHAGFYLSRQTLSIGVIGAGTVGRTLLRQLAEQSPHLKDRYDLDLRVRAIATSKLMLLGERALDLHEWRDALAAGGETIDIDRFVDHVHADHLPHSVLIDCTASDDIARRYGDWLARGLHVITPNKRANTAGIEYYRQIREANRTQGAHYLYETTVGAALPIIQTLRDLVHTGDEVIEIEGILSGTLSWLFNSFDGTQPFSDLVEKARSLGYTEPDPRDDLSGMDVARKVVILAREMGLPLELSNVQVQGLVPESLRNGGVAEFMAALPAHDENMAALGARSAADGKMLRYVGRVDREGNASTTLREYPVGHPFTRIRLTDNIVLFRTRRYDEHPLIVQGPGAGPEVTAGGVFADLLRLSSYLGAMV